MIRARARALITLSTLALGGVFEVTRKRVKSSHPNITISMLDGRTIYFWLSCAYYKESIPKNHPNATRADESSLGDASCVRRPNIPTNGATPQ